jgi:heterodisulfide reductase subunit C2
MTMRIAKKKTASGLLTLVEKRAGVKLDACFQCKKCTIGCPVADQSVSAPAEIIRRLQLGAGEELLKTELIWNCLCCETCYSRCPNQINFPAVIDALKALAVEKGVANPKGNAPLFNKMFLSTVKYCGRSYDLAAIALYKMGSGNLMQDLEKFPGMLLNGKIAILPPTGADMLKVKRIFRKATKDKGPVRRSGDGEGGTGR